MLGLNGEHVRRAVSQSSAGITEERNGYRDLTNRSRRFDLFAASKLELPTLQIG